MCGCTISVRVKEITHDLNNYGDVIHHSPAIDLKILSLAGGAENTLSTPTGAAGVAGAAQGAGRGVSRWSQLETSL